MRRLRGRAAVAGAIVAGLLLVAGCGAEDAGDGTDVADQGYQSGDGSTRTWAVDDRSEPVAIVGTDFEGVEHDLTAWRGDVVVLNTWYAACPPCRAEAPDLAAFATDYADQGVRVLGINGTDDAGAAQAFQRTFEIPYPSIADGDRAAIAELQGAVPVQAVPTTVVLDQEGRVAARVLGAVEASTLRGLVDDVLAEAQAATP